MNKPRAKNRSPYERESHGLGLPGKAHKFKTCSNCQDLTMVKGKVHIRYGGGGSSPDEIVTVYTCEICSRSEELVTGCIGGW
ncbi:MAG TPA: hypothetical protein V6D07_06265 [Trichocoleus sp.]